MELVECFQHISMVYREHFLPCTPSKYFLGFIKAWIFTVTGDFILWGSSSLFFSVYILNTFYLFFWLFFLRFHSPLISLDTKSFPIHKYQHPWTFDTSSYAVIVSFVVLGKLLAKCHRLFITSDLHLKVMFLDNVIIRADTQTLLFFSRSPIFWSAAGSAPPELFHYSKNSLQTTPKPPGSPFGSSFTPTLVPFNSFSESHLMRFP